MTDITRVSEVGPDVHFRIRQMPRLLAVNGELVVADSEAEFFAAQLDKVFLFLDVGRPAEFDLQASAVGETRIKPMERSSTSNVPPATFSPNWEWTESEIVLSANLQYVHPLTATGLGLPIKCMARSIK